MSGLFWLSDAQMVKLEPFFPKPHCKSRVDDRPVLGGTILINRYGCAGVTLLRPMARKRRFSTGGRGVAIGASLRR